MAQGGSTCVAIVSSCSPERFVWVAAVNAHPQPEEVTPATQLLAAMLHGAQPAATAGKIAGLLGQNGLASVQVRRS